MALIYTNLYFSDFIYAQAFQPIYLCVAYAEA